MTFSKKILAVTASFIIGYEAFSASTITEPDLNEISWRYLQTAELALQVGNYGDAIKACEDAKFRRAEESSYETQVLDKAITPREVSREGDLLSDVMPVLRRRQADQALKIINKYLELFGSEYFNNSVSTLYSYVQKRKEYPEADYMIGRIYQYEGEYELAEEYYIKAYKQSDFLEIPDVKYDILYDMAQLARILGKDDDYEKYLTLIIADDKHFWDSGLDRALRRTIDSNAPDSAEKFFKLYRTKDHRSIAAYEALSEYYISIGDEDKALKAISFAALTGFSKIYDIVKERDTSFVYKNLKEFFLTISSYGDIVDWGIDNNIWKSFYLLAEYSKRHGKNVFAEKLFTVIAESFPEEYWRNKAAIALKKI